MQDNESPNEAVRTEVLELLHEISEYRREKEVISIKEEMAIVKLEAIRKNFQAEVGNTSESPDFVERMQDVVSDMSVRDATVAVLKRSSSGLRPKDIVKALREADYPYKGSTDFGTRISNELLRLRKRGAVARRDGRYTFVPEPN